MQRVASPSPGASVSGEASGVGIVGHDGREMEGLARAMQRSTSNTGRLNTIEDHVVRNASNDNSAYEPVKPRRWSKSPVMAPPLHMDRPDEEYTYLKTKLYPHMSFGDISPSRHSRSDFTAKSSTLDQVSTFRPSPSWTFVTRARIPVFSSKPDPRHGPLVLMSLISPVAQLQRF